MWHTYSNFEDGHTGHILYDASMQHYCAGGYPRRGWCFRYGANKKRERACVRPSWGVGRNTPRVSDRVRTTSWGIVAHTKRGFDHTARARKQYLPCANMNAVTRRTTPRTRSRGLL